MQKLNEQEKLHFQEEATGGKGKLERLPLVTLYYLTIKTFLR